MITPHKWTVIEQRVAARLTSGSHFCYYALVFIQADHGYRYAAGMLFIMMVVDWAIAKHTGESIHD